MRGLAAEGLAHSEVATALGVSINSVVSAAAFYGVTIARHTAAERAAFLERERTRIKATKQKHKHKVVAETRKAAGLPPVSKTSPEYRNQLPKIGEQSKTQLRAMLATALSNTAEMSV
jgi:hypothetical protein